MLTLASGGVDHPGRADADALQRARVDSRLLARLRHRSGHLARRRPVGPPSVGVGWREEPSTLLRAVDDDRLDLRARRGRCRPAPRPVSLLRVPSPCGDPSRIGGRRRRASARSSELPSGPRLPVVLLLGRRLVDRHPERRQLQAPDFPVDRVGHLVHARCQLRAARERAPRRTAPAARTTRPSPPPDGPRRPRGSRPGRGLSGSACGPSASTYWSTSGRTARTPPVASASSSSRSSSTSKWPGVGQQRAVLHPLEVLAAQDPPRSRHRDEDVARARPPQRRHHLVAGHPRLERPHRVDFANDHV